MKPMYQRKRGLLRVAAIGQVIIMAGAGCKSSSPKEGMGTNDVSVSQALVGKDGSLTVTGTTPVVVNGYAALAADVAAAATGVQVVNLNSFTATNTRPSLAVGDVVLIVQMAGATISVPADANDSTYGAVTSLGSAGRYEFAGVTAIDLGTNTISLGCGLKNSYTANGKTQVVRVPQYTNLTINSGASITADAWNGTVGGLVAVHAMNTITVTGDIDVSGKGFRGGVAHAGSNDAGANVTAYWSASGDSGAMKGEGIAGDPNDAGFTNKYGRGAPANAGGGGNVHNSGGGGGANASAAGAWTGQGVMLGTVAGAGAWALDPNTGANSPGGGRGGYTYSDSNQNGATLAPGQAAWGGNNRRERGGLGGHSLASSTGGTDARLFLGGGGGAGDGNDGQPVSGGAGGGLVFLIAGTVTGAGHINANGTHGGDSGSANPTSNSDGGGGGGGGGTIVVHAGVLSQVQIAANGGRGGNQTFSGTTGTEAEGPGGGGGGGYVAFSGGTPGSVAADGALGGTTNSPALAEFPSNGATAGHAGITNASAASLMYCTDHVAPTAIIITKPSNPSTSGTATFTFGAVEANSAVDAGDSSASFVCSLDGAAFTSCPPTYIVPGLADGTHTMKVRVVDLSGNDAGVGGEDVYTWRVDLIAPVPRVVTGPGGSASGGTSNSSTASFTLNATERDSGIETVTFLCRLDSSTAAFTECNGTGTATPTFSGLADGTHTLDVRARDDAGNVTAEVDTVRWAWTVHALDAGDDSLDAGPADASGLDAVMLEDAEEADDAGGTVLLDASPDTRRDALVADRPVDTTQTDTPISRIDAATDGVDAEAGIFLLDAGDAADGLSSDAKLSETGAVDSGEPVKDSAVAPSPDAYVPTPDSAGPPPVQQDAAVEPVGGFKLMGGGFCSMNPSGHSTPGLATLFLVAAFGLMIVRRRRR
jgi:hypothetical protein